MTQPVVGIGASAGGLEVFKLLLRHLPADTGLAFVFVQHLDPKHHSNLSDILSRVSAIPVHQADDGMKIEPNHLYVIPPDAELEIADHVLRMTPRGVSWPGSHKSIDRLLRSLAQECGTRAIGVILSGAGTDGAAGLAAVKEAGGVTFAQDPTTAEFDSMPRTAIETECVDFVLSPGGIGAELVKLGHHSYFVEDEDTGSMNPDRAPEDDFGPIFKLLRDATKVDFSLYREDMIRRRIVRRLALRNLDSLDEYRKQIEHDPRELAALQGDLLIGVTQFFRDPESFVKLKRLVFPRMLRNRTDSDPIRVWVPGCSTGEEAYSIAISLHEYLSEANDARPVQIFASDISSTAVEKARRGKYAGSIVADGSPDRLERYFLKANGGYQISKALREMCVFSRHDLMQDPPFSKMDLISCLNVLIFFGPVRKNVIALLHYALKPSRFLVLGPSETEAGQGFSMVEGARSIYMKNETVGKQYSPYVGARGRRPISDPYKKVLGEPLNPHPNGIDLRKEAERLLLSRYSGAGVVVDETLEILEIVGRTTPYLSLPTGNASLNLLRLIPEARLLLEVEKLVREVQSSGEPAKRRRVPCQGGTAGREVNLEVIPVGGARTRALLILFEPASGGTESDHDSSVHQRDPEIARLKQDLADARSRLLSILDQHHSSEKGNEDAVEEAISANEELQSLNEELETTKEELQSTNEELATVNAELTSNNAALVEARDYGVRIIEAVTAPLVVLDMELRIQIANPAFYCMFRMSPGEAEGQFFYSVSNGCWDIPGVRGTLEHILPDEEAIRHIEIEHEFPIIGRRVLVLSARRLEGLQQILIGIEDVTERQERAQAALHESEERFRNVVDSAPVMIWVSGADRTRSFFNRAWLAFYRPYIGK
jgi:two-component system, chemotaxis family, CheB/CheR fusion protein